MPNPTQAANACSMVLTFAPLNSNVVPRSVSVAQCASAGIVGSFFKSIRLNTKPVFTYAGLNVKVQCIPVCSPSPSILTSSLIVC